jgi:hypothetical protein
MADIERGNQRLGGITWCRRNSLQCLAIAAIAFLLGVLVCGLVGGNSASSSGRTHLGLFDSRSGSVLASVNKTALQEDELDGAVATYVLDGTAHSISARDALSQDTSVDVMRAVDGSYPMPTVSSVLSLARNQILAMEAESRGISASDKDVAEYAEKMLGTKDIGAIADSYHMDQDSTSELLHMYALVNMLRSEVVGTKAVTEPAAPTSIEGVDDNTPRIEYAEYIIDLVGSEWDAEADDWADKNSPFALTLSEYTIGENGATYKAAQAAYYVARQAYLEAASEASSVWDDFCNGLFCKASIQLSSLIA